MRAVLVQNGAVIHDIDLREADRLERLVEDFYTYKEPEVEQFEQAVERFREDIPQFSGELQDADPCRESRNAHISRRVHGLSRFVPPSD